MNNPNKDLNEIAGFFCEPPLLLAKLKKELIYHLCTIKTL